MSSLGEPDPCAVHLQEAMRKFDVLLQKGLCICRTVIGRTEKCCDEQRRRAAIRSWRRRKELEKNSCTVFSATNGEKSYSKVSCGNKTRNDALCSDRTCQASGCYESTQQGHLSDLSAKEDSDLGLNIEGILSPVVAANADIEASAAREHVVFTISGMTCTGCVKKMIGVCNHVVGISNVNVNFVAATGEVDVDTSITSIDQVLQQLERETGFECKRITFDLLAFDVFMTAKDAAALEHNQVSGIESIEKVKKGLYSISFNPTVIGARAVLARSCGSLAAPRRDDAIVHGHRKLVKKLCFFILAALMTIPVVVFAWADPPVSYNVKSAISLALGTLVVLIAVPEFYIPALKALIFSRSIEMDMLVVISISAAYIYSVIAFGLTHAGFHLEQKEFFETSSLLVTLVILGRLVSAYAKLEAVNAVSMKSLQAEIAHLDQPLILPSGAQANEIDARLLEYGDLMRIIPHSRVVTDGEVISGQSSVDESMITGEDIPVGKFPGNNVVAGTINGTGLLIVRVTRLPGQNSISDISHLVSNALGAKPRVQDLADTVAGWFVPVVVGISTIVFIIWLALGLEVRHLNGGGAIGLSITYAIAVLAISCPCAIGLAVPLVLVVASGISARAGVIIKQADAIEKGDKITDVVFDKTGTLTIGDLHVVRHALIPCVVDEDEILGISLAVTKDSEHPVSRAVAEFARNTDCASIILTQIESIPGSGVMAQWLKKKVKAGNPRWGKVDDDPIVKSFLEDGLTLLCVSLDDQLIAMFGLRASSRPEASNTIRSLQIRGIDCHVVSGDNASSVTTLACSLGIDADMVVAEKKPSEKQKYIESLQDKNRVVLFIGDGTNDAPAIAQADLGVHIGDTSDVSRAAADVVLLGGIDGVLTLLDVSKYSFRRIVFNFGWSFVYNLFAILLASGAFVKFRIPPAYAGLGEIVSVLPVVLGALSLLKVKVGRVNRV